MAKRKDILKPKILMYIIRSSNVIKDSVYKKIMIFFLSQLSTSTPDIGKERIAPILIIAVFIEKYKGEPVSSKIK